MRVEGQMLDRLASLIRRVVGFQWHAIITHAVHTVPAEVGIPLTRDFAITFPPILINRVFYDELPGPFSDRNVTGRRENRRWGDDIHGRER